MGQRIRPAQHAEIPELHLRLAGRAWMAGLHCFISIPGGFAYPDHGIHAKPFVPAHRLVRLPLHHEISPVLTEMLEQAVHTHDHGSRRLRDSLQLVRRQAPATIRRRHACSLRCRFLCHLYSLMGFGAESPSLRSVWEIRQFWWLGIDWGSLYCWTIGGFCCVHREFTRFFDGCGMH
jgi:hypothetical protein